MLFVFAFLIGFRVKLLLLGADASVLLGAPRVVLGPQVGPTVLKGQQAHFRGLIGDHIAK